LIPVKTKHINTTADGDNGGKEGRTERVDDTFILLGYAVHTANPLAAITERANTLDAVWTLEGRDEKVPWKKCERE
jgi:hypothetical protein